ncbi:hypothetical protein KCP78_21665 [Salmonella enterica subsp. enterica]|nr:hypothetical protein KCP78_21665 [Salmonella enterica subsp. enterica]
MSIVFYARRSPTTVPLIFAGRQSNHRRSQRTVYRVTRRDAVAVAAICERHRHGECSASAKAESVDMPPSFIAVSAFTVLNVPLCQYQFHVSNIFIDIPNTACSVE